MLSRRRDRMKVFAPTRPTLPFKKVGCLYIIEQLTDQTAIAGFVPALEHA